MYRALRTVPFYLLTDYGETLPWSRVAGRGSAVVLDYHVDLTREPQKATGTR